MKKLILLLAIMLFTTQVFALDMSQEDKQSHALISAGFGIAVDTYIYHHVDSVSDFWRPVVAYSAAMLPGRLKELVDKKGDWEDIEADALGAGSGVLTSEIFNRLIGPSKYKEMLAIRATRDQIFISISGKF